MLRLREILCARACVFSLAPRSLSPKLETTRSLNESYGVVLSYGTVYSAVKGGLSLWMKSL